MANLKIDRFIWSFQHHFCSNAKYSARKLFQALDTRFEPNVFLVGIMEAKQEGKHEACVQPEKDFWAKSERFEGLGETIKENIESDPESQMLHSHPRMQTLANERLLANAIRQAIQNTIAKIEERPNDQVFYVGFPRLKDGYWGSWNDASYQRCSGNGSQTTKHASHTRCPDKA